MRRTDNKPELNTCQVLSGRDRSHSGYYFIYRVTATFGEVTFEQKPEAKGAVHKDINNNKTLRGVGRAAYLKLLNYLKPYYLIYRDHLPFK